MNFILQPWQLLVAVLAGWVDHEQQKIIQFYQADVKAMMEAQGEKRLLLSDDNRSFRLAQASGISSARIEWLRECRASGMSDRRASYAW